VTGRASRAASPPSSSARSLLKKAEPIITDLAKKEGVHLIIDQSATIWADPTVDLTSQLNAQMK
jgi:Skp family chaperone for outer membrane proteins